MPHLSRLLLQQRLQEKRVDWERGSYALALRHPVPKELNYLPGLQLLPFSMLILISVLHWYGKRMARVRHPPPPPGGSSVDYLTPTATPRPRRNRARLHTPIGINHTFRSISTCHNSGAIVTICRSSITTTRRPGSCAGTGPGSRTESGSQSRSGTGDRFSAGAGTGVNPQS